MQAKGRLQGEELLQFQERGVALQEELRKLYKLSGDEFQDALSKGKISAEAVELAIVRLTSVGGKYANGAIAQSDTLAGKFSTLQDGVDSLARVLGQTLSPVLKQLLDDVTNFVNSFAQGLQVIQNNYNAFLANLRGQTATELQGQVGQLDKFIAENQKQLAKVKPGGQTEKQIQAKIIELRKLRGSLQKDLDKKLGLVAPVGATTLLPATAANQTPPPLLGDSKGGKKGKSDAERAAEKAARDAERLAQQIAKQKAVAAETLAVEKGRLQIAETVDPVQQQITAAIVKQNDIQREFNGRLKEAKSAEETLNLQLAEKNALQTNALELQKALDQEINQIAQPLEELTKASAERLAVENKYQQILAQGVNPELAKEFTQLELAAEKQSELLNLRLAELEAAKAKLNAESDVAKALQSQIDKIKEILKLQKGQVDESKKETEEEQKKRQDREARAQNAVDQAERLKALYRGIVDTIEDGIVNTLSTGIEGLIRGTKDLGQALQDIASGILKDIGQQLLRFGVNIGLRAAFPGAFAAEGAYWSGGFSAFADGGLVTKPTLGLVGEGNQPEYIIPASKMSAAMSRYAAGSRGASVIPSGSEQASSTALVTAPMEPIDVRYSVERINNVDYVTTDQFQRGLAQAAQQGAIQGERRALRTLGNSPANRRRIGL